MIIGFSGHRNCVTDELELLEVAKAYPGAFWLHGGAEGFDTQVDTYGKSHGITVMPPLKPNYKKFSRFYAPIQRNRLIVDQSDIMVICWDGRTRGGTNSTREYAEKQDKFIWYVKAIPL